MGHQTSLESLLQYSTNLIVNNFFLMSCLNFPLAQFSAIPSCAIISYQWEKTNTSLFTLSSREIAESNEVTSQLLLLIRQLKCPQKLLTRHAFLPFYQLCWPPLDVYILFFFFFCGVQNLKQYSWWGCTNAKYRSRSTSFNWLAMLCVMHPKMAHV